MVSTRTTASNGYITVKCKDANGNQIDVRVEGIKDSNGNTVTGQYFEGKTIDVVGIIDFFNYEGYQNYQILVFDFNKITFH